MFDEQSGGVRSLAYILFQFENSHKNLKMCFPLCRIPAHRLVLCAATDFFHSLLTTPMLEQNQNEIEILNFSGAILQQVVHCCYSGVIQINDDNIEELLAASSFFLFPFMQERCIEYLSQPGVVNVSNCLGVWVMATRFSYPELKRVATVIILENFLEVVLCDEFLRLNKLELLEILSSSEIAVESEEDVLNALVKWTEFDLAARSNMFADLVRVVRIKRLTFSVSI